MPCHDPRPAEDYDAAVEKCDKLTRLLCEACRELRSNGLIHRLGSELRSWWAIHEEDDARREG